MKRTIVPLFAAVTVTAASSESATAAALLVPAYFHPATHAAEWTALADAASKVSVTAIFNPASGPGSTRDDAYVAPLAAFRAAGGRAIAYVHTKNGDGSLRALATMHAEVDAYRSMYGTFDGFFIDEMSETAAEAAFYANIYQYVKSKNAADTVVGNPGTGVPQAYAAAADVLVTVEDYQSAYADISPRAWTQSLPADRFANIVHHAPENTLRAVLAQAAAKNVGYVYVTDDGADGNPYDSLPSFWAAEVAAVPEPTSFVALAGMACVLIRRTSAERSRKERA